MEDIFAAVKPRRSDDDKEGGTVLVIGGGKSAMEYVSPLIVYNSTVDVFITLSICAKLANEGRRVIIAFETPDAFIAAPVTLPNFIRKSRLYDSRISLQLVADKYIIGRLLSVLTPHIFLKTRLEYVSNVHLSIVGWVVLTFKCVQALFAHDNFWKLDSSVIFPNAAGGISRSCQFSAR